jgi:hypothetical protein
LNFLDISYATEITDEGLSYFKEKVLPIGKLYVNGLTGITAAGLSEIIGTCKETLKVIEATLMD